MPIERGEGNYGRRYDRSAIIDIEHRRDGRSRSAFPKSENDMRPFLAILLVGILGNSCIRAAEYELIIKSAKIKSTKADDKAWDLLDDPDPYAVVGMIGKRPRPFPTP